MIAAMIHGWSSSQASWYPVLPYLSHAQTYFIHLAGHHGQPDTLTIAEQMEAINQPCLLYGWSLGSLLALDYALAYPDRISGLVLFSPIACFIQTPHWPDAMPLDTFSKFERRFFKKGYPDYHYFALLAAAGTDNPRRYADMLLELNQQFEQPSLAGLQSGLLQLKNYDITHKLGQLQKPVLLISGDQDALVSAQSVRQLSEKITQATVNILKNTGHLPHITHPARCGEIIDIWRQNESL